MKFTAALPAAASNIDSLKATGHAMAAENRATDAAIDRATGNPVGAAINENRALGHSIASGNAASRSTIEAGMAGGLGGSAMAAAGANVAANMAGRSALASPGLMGPVGMGPALPYAPAVGYPYQAGYGAGYGYPYAPLGQLNPLGYNAGRVPSFPAGAAASGVALANGVVGSALGGLGNGLGVSYYSSSH